MSTESLFALSILILGTLLTLEDLRFGVFLFLLFIPLLNKIYFSLVVWDLLPIRIITISLAVIAIIRFIQWWRDEDNSIRKKRASIRKFFKDKFLILLLILWVIRLISFLKAENLKQSFLLLGFYTSMIFLYGFLKYIYGKYKEGVFLQNVNFYMVVGVIASIYAFFQLYLSTKSIVLPGVWAVPGHIARVGSTFWDVNHFAAFLLTLIPLSFSFVLLSRKKDQKITNLIVLFIFLTALFLTGSRSAWLGFGVSLASLLFLFVKNKYKFVSYSIFSFLVVLLVTIPTYNFLNGISTLEKIERYIDYRSESFGAHIWLLQGAWEIFLENPIIGGGYGNFDENFRKTEISKRFFVRDSLPSDVRIPSHSIWGEVLAETGALGFIVYFALMAYPIIILFRSMGGFRDKWRNLISIGLMASILGLLSAGIFYTYNLEFFWLIIFWGVIHARSYR